MFTVHKNKNACPCVHDVDVFAVHMHDSVCAYSILHALLNVY